MTGLKKLTNSEGIKRLKQRPKEGKTGRGSKPGLTGPKSTPVLPGEEHLQNLTEKGRKAVKLLAQQMHEYGETDRPTVGIQVFDVDDRLIASQRISALFKKEDFRQAYIIELQRLGVDDKRAAAVMDGAFSAKKTIRDKKTGEVIDEEPDHVTRLSALREYNKIKDLYPTQRHVVDKRESRLNLTAKSPKELRELREALSKEINGLQD